MQLIRPGGVSFQYVSYRIAIEQLEARAVGDAAPWPATEN